MHDGAPYYKVSPLQDGDALAAMFAFPARKSDYPEETCVVTVTRGGLVKKSLISELPGPSAQTFTLVKVNDGDRLASVGLTDGRKEVLLVTAQGMAIRFKEDDVRPMGLVAAGVNGIKLDVGDEVVGVEILPAEGEVFLLASDGKAKRVEQKDFPSQGRYGKGVKAWELPKRVTVAGTATGKPNHIATIHLSKGAPKSTRLDAANIRKRAATRGDAVVEAKPGEEVIGVVIGWTVEKFVKANKEEEKPAKKEGRTKKASPRTRPAKKVKGKSKKK